LKRVIRIALTACLFREEGNAEVPEARVDVRFCPEAAIV
jgi:hypothetical protein